MAFGGNWGSNWENKGSETKLLAAVVGETIPEA